LWGRRCAATLRAARRRCLLSEADVRPERERNYQRNQKRACIFHKRECYRKTSRRQAKNVATDVTDLKTSARKSRPPVPVSAVRAGTRVDAEGAGFKVRGRFEVTTEGAESTEPKRLRVSR
jgi:hypothetical protein